jgi:Flp pilus assembly protein TadG
MTSTRTLGRKLRALRSDTSGVALLEFAFMLPIFLTISLTGAEVTNYVITKMRVAQVALHLADNAARIGTGSQLEAKTITESDVNDLLMGAQYQSGELDLFAKGRVIISSVEPMASPNTTNKFKIRWQRCKGTKTTHASTYGAAGATNIDGMGPAGRKALATEDGVAMFVEVYYEYTPLVKTSLSPSSNMTETASMLVRDRRDTSSDSKLANGSNNPDPQHPDGVYKVNGVTASTC